MNGSSLSQGINKKAVQVDFNGCNRTSPRQVQIELLPPQVNHNDTIQAKNIVQVKSKITTNKTVSVDYAGVTVKLSEESDPPEFKPGRPAIDHTPGKLSEDESLRHIIDIIVTRTSTVVMGANSENIRSFFQQIDTHDVLAGRRPSLKEVDTWRGTISLKHFTDIKEGKIILSELIDKLQHGRSIPWISNDERIYLGRDSTTSWWVGNIPVSQFDDKIIARLTDMIVKHKIATCRPVDNITHNVDINQIVKIELTELDGSPSYDATDGHPGNDKMHNNPIALSRAEEWSNLWVTILSQEEYAILVRQTVCDHCKISYLNNTAGPPISCKGSLTGKWTCSKCAAIVAANFCGNKGITGSILYVCGTVMEGTQAERKDMYAPVNITSIMGEASDEMAQSFTAVDPFTISTVDKLFVSVSWLSMMDSMQLWKLATFPGICDSISKSSFAQQLNEAFCAIQYSPDGTFVTNDIAEHIAYSTIPSGIQNSDCFAHSKLMQREAFYNLGKYKCDINAFIITTDALLTIVKLLLMAIKDVFIHMGMNPHSDELHFISFLTTDASLISETAIQIQEQVLCRLFESSIEDSGRLLTEILMRHIQAQLSKSMVMDGHLLFDRNFAHDMQNMLDLTDPRKPSSNIVAYLSYQFVSHLILHIQ